MPYLLCRVPPPKSDVLDLSDALPHYIALYYPERYIFSITSHAF
jgi:hypothetical protein